MERSMRKAFTVGLYVGAFFTLIGVGMGGAFCIMTSAQ